MTLLKVIIDFDGTLTAEETQVATLAALSLDTLSAEILYAPRATLEADYRATQARLKAAPLRYYWEVNGLNASYCDEGAFILNTTTLQVMLRDNADYARAVSEAFPAAEYDPVIDCTNYLFHRHTAEIPPRFRPAARQVLAALSARPDCRPMVLTNSLGDKVRRHLDTLGLDREVAILGDTRQYEMAPGWTQRFPQPGAGQDEEALLGSGAKPDRSARRLAKTCQVWELGDGHSVDLRRPAYYRALVAAAADGSRLAVVADTFSLPGGLPLVMGIPFFLLRTPYTPEWCAKAVAGHPLGHVLDDLAGLPEALDLLSPG